jgi:hypothetical protein
MPGNVGAAELLIMLLLWGSIIAAVVFVVRYMTSRACPRCGRRVRNGRLDCGKCGFDFHSVSAQ